MNYANINDNPFVKYDQIPDEWKGIDGYKYATTEQLLKDGFWELKMPVYDIEKQYLGEIIKGTKDFTYEVLDYSVEQIQQKIIENAEIMQQTLIDEKIKEQNTKVVLDEVQAETDVVKILENQSIYPLWDGNRKDYVTKIKCQWFNDKNEMVLWECIQPVTSQEQYPPLTIPAHFKRVAKDGEILVWKQPLGSEDAYKKGVVVWFPTLNSNKYESLIDNNVYSPTAYPQGWKKL